MASTNPFDLLGDDDTDDPSQLIAAQQQKIAAKKPTPAASAAAPSAPARLPSKPAPPSQAVREARSNTAPARGGGGSRGAAGRGRGGRGGASGPNRDFGNANANGFSGGYGGGGGGGEDGDTGNPSERERGSYGAPRQPYRGGRRGGYGNEEAGGDSERPPRRIFERRSGTGRGNETKRDGGGRGNWGTPTDDVLPQENEEVMNTADKVVPPEKEQEDAPVSESNKEGKEGAVNETEEKEPEDKEMTLEEYEKIREEKRKALLALKAEERKVAYDKEFESMQQLSVKKENNDVFIKLGSDKDSGKRKENVKKSVSINEFLKPAEGERYFSPGGRGRGRGRGDHGPFRGGFGSGGTSTLAAPSIEDPGQFPSLGGK